jgi:hypothetical protein
MRQTAVEILYKFLYEMESFEGFDPYSFNQEDVFKRAKEMEKEQMEKVWVTGLYCETGDRQAFIDYYNETFKSE